MNEFFAMPPVHPMLVNFTAALIPASIISDALGLALRREGLKAAGFWTMLYASIMTPLTVASGWWWYKQMGLEESGMMELHQWLGTCLAAVLAAMAYWRWRFYRTGTNVSARYALAGGLLLGAIIVQGHAGAVMSFPTDAEVAEGVPHVATSPATRPAE